MPIRSCILRCVFWVIFSIGIVEGTLGFNEGIAQKNGNVSYADSKESIINELRWITQTLRQYHLQINPKLPIRASELNQLLQEYELTFLQSPLAFNSQVPEMSLKLAQIQVRDQLESNSAYLHYLKLFIQVLYQNELPLLAQKLILTALQQTKMTSSQYEDFLIYFFQKSLGKLSKTDLIRNFQIYTRLRAKTKRQPSDMMRYLYAKSLYFLNEWTDAENQFKQLQVNTAFYIRSQYFLGLIALRQKKFKDGIKHFQSVLDFLQKQKNTDQKTPKTALQNPPSSSEDQSTSNKDTLDLSNPDKYKVVSKRGKLTVHCIISPTSPCSASVQSSSKKQKASRRLELDLDRAFQQFDPKSHLPPHHEKARTQDQLMLLLHLALARLWVIEGDLAKAWQAYRQVPLSRESFSQEAFLEAIYVLARQGAYTQAADFLDQAISRRELNQEYVDLKVWQAELYVKGEAQKKETSDQSDGAQKIRRIYSRLQNFLKKKKPQLQSAQTSKVLFPPDVTNWIPPHITKAVTQLEITIRMQENELESQIKIIWKQLMKALKTQNFPQVNAGKRIIKKGLKQIENLQKKIQFLAPQWKKGQLYPSPFRNISAQRLNEKAALVNQRLITMGRMVIKHEQNLLRILPKLLLEQQKQFDQISQKLKQSREQLKRLSTQLKKLALHQIDQNLARLILGDVNLAFWRKEQASEEVQALRDQRLKELNVLRPLNAQNRQFKDLPVFLESNISIIESALPSLESLRSKASPDPVLVNKQKNTSRKLNSPSSSPKKSLPSSPAPSASPKSVPGKPFSNEPTDDFELDL